LISFRSKFCFRLHSASCQIWLVWISLWPFSSTSFYALVCNFDLGPVFISTHVQTQPILNIFKEHLFKVPRWAFQGIHSRHAFAFLQLYRPSTHGSFSTFKSIVNGTIFLSTQSSSCEEALGYSLNPFSHFPQILTQSF